MYVGGNNGTVVFTGVYMDPHVLTLSSSNFCSSKLMPIQNSFLKMVAITYI